MKPAVLTGEHYITGDVACAEGAIAAGCKFFGRLSHHPGD